MDSPTFPRLLLAFLATFLCMPTLQAQEPFPSPEEIETTIRTLDAEFWTAYNACDVDKMATFVTEDFEFYHDKGGLTSGKETFVKGLSERLCAGDTRLRREAIESTVEVFPLNGYGAILSGDHVFYVKMEGRDEFKDGKAKFTHVWRLAEGKWQMARVLSYDHKAPQEQQASEREIQLVPADVLEAYIGEYEGPESGAVTVNFKDDVLEMVAGGKSVGKIYPESETVFFHKEQPLTFEFVKGKQGKVEKMLVRENGEVVEEVLRVK